MAEMNEQWQRVQRTDQVTEYFKFGEFIASDKWERSCPPDVINNNYPYWKDYFYWDANKRNKYGRDIKNEIRMTKIAHVTSWEKSLSIIEDGGFRPNTKHIPGIGAIDLIWFGPKVEESEIDSVREKYKRCARGIFGNDMDLAHAIASQFANTTPFQPMSRYGNVKFTLSIKNVIKAYEEQFCRPTNDEMQIIKLGTFAYKQETMHVILVHNKATSDIDQSSPLLSDDDDPIIQPDEHFKTWTWRPHSTGNSSFTVTQNGEFEDPTYKRWEHVCFAFRVPEGSCLKIDDLDDNVSLCLHLHLRPRVEIICIDKVIVDILCFIQEENNDYTTRKTLANLLARMIRGYIDELSLYKKTVFGINYNIDINYVQRSFKKMLPNEYEGLKELQSLIKSQK